MDAPMVVAVRCRALSERELDLGRSRFPNRADCHFSSAFTNVADKSVLTIDPDSVFLSQRVSSAGCGGSQPSSLAGCLASASPAERTRLQQERRQFFEAHHDRRFHFDFVFDEFASNAAVYRSTVAPLVDAVRSGYNGTCFAYGMTGAGKTWTMMGCAPAAGGSPGGDGGVLTGRPRSLTSFSGAPSSDAGICAHAVHELFERRHGVTRAPPCSGRNGGGGGAFHGNPYDDDHHFEDDEEAARDGAEELTVHASYLEIYNERIRDLLSWAAPALKAGTSRPQSASSASSRSSSCCGGHAGAAAASTPPSLDIVEDPSRGVLVHGLSEVQVSCTAELQALLDRGAELRTKASTASNVVSSRSHAVLQLTVRRQCAEGTAQRRGATADASRGTKIHFLSGKLSLIDLAGSERASGEDGLPKGERGNRRREGANINKSLLALGNCITVLGQVSLREQGARDGGARGLSAASAGVAGSSSSFSHVPYRDSKLTRLLKESLGGNTRTVMIAAISPSCLCYEETLSTLKYATRARAISKKIHRNKICLHSIESAADAGGTNSQHAAASATDQGALLHALEDEVRSLRTLLSVTNAASQRIGLAPLLPPPPPPCASMAIAAPSRSTSLNSSAASSITTTSAAPSHIGDAAGGAGEKVIAHYDPHRLSAGIRAAAFVHSSTLSPPSTNVNVSDSAMRVNDSNVDTKPRCRHFGDGDHSSDDEGDEIEMLHRLKAKVAALQAAKERPPVRGGAPLSAVPTNAFASVHSDSSSKRPVRGGTATSSIGGMMSPAPDDALHRGGGGGGDGNENDDNGGAAGSALRAAAQSRFAAAEVTAQLQREQQQYTGVWRKCDNSYYIPCDAAEATDDAARGALVASGTGDFEGVFGFAATPAGRAALLLQQQEECSRRQGRSAPISFLDLLTSRQETN